MLMMAEQQKTLLTLYPNTDVKFDN